MAKFLPKNRQTRITVFVIASAILLAGGGLFAVKVGKPFARSWLENRNIQVAREHQAKGDATSALLAIRQVLGKNPNNIEALKMAIDITEKQNSPDTLSFQLKLAQSQPTLANKLRVLELCIKFGAPQIALDTIQKMGPEGAESAEYHKLSAKILLTINERTKAKYHLFSLTKLRPDDIEARLDLAQLRLNDGFDDNRPAIRAEIRSLAANPDLRIRAITLLLKDALQSQDPTSALEFADQLQLSTGLQTLQELLILDAYRLHAPIKFASYSNTLKNAYAKDAPKVISLANLLLNSGHSKDIKAWIETLDEKVRAVEGVQLAYAFALLYQKEIARLDEYLRSCKWAVNEYARQALIAYSRKTSGDEKGFAEAWKLALINIGNDPQKLYVLTSQILAWGWEDQKYELLWKRFTLFPREEEVRQQLVLHEFNKGNTAALNRLYARVSENNPTDTDSKNSYAYTAILLNQSPDRAYQAAEETYKSSPKNPYYITTHALALARQGKPEQAIEIINSLDFAAKLDPVRTIVRAYILSLNKNYKEAADAVTYFKPRKILPEELRMLEETRRLIAQNLRDTNQAQQLATYQQATGNTSRDGWIALIPAELRRPDDIKQQLAEKVYAENDHKALESSLRTEKWEDNDFLRLALLSYAQRRLEKETESRSNWRFALTLARNNPAGLQALLKFTTEWKWDGERLDVLNRLFQNDPLNQEIFDELYQHFTDKKQTGELAQLFQARVDARPGDNVEKTNFAYFSLLAGRNLSRAHVTAKEVHEADPTNPYAAATYAYSLSKQNRAADGLKILEKFPDKASSGIAQISLHKALLSASVPGNTQLIQSLLLSFDAKSALPEEAELAATLARQNGALR